MYINRLAVHHSLFGKHILAPAMSAWSNILTSQMIPETPKSSIPTNPSLLSGAAASSAELLATKSCIAAIDMDCFYAQCEELRRPELKGKPVGVQQKNLVITSNYAARAFGIKKGDSLQVVREKCPDITICNGEDLTFYGQISQQVFDVASRFSAKVEKLGLDEVFVEMTEQVDERLTDGKFEEGSIPIPVQGAVYPETADLDKFSTVEAMCWKRLHVASQLCQEIREAISREVGLTSSAGVSVSKLLAKLVASWKKPAMQTIFIPIKSCLSNLLPDTLAIQKIPGIGFASTQRCNVLGIHTIKDLVSSAESVDSQSPLLSAFDASTIKTMRLLCLGVDRSSVKASGAPKSCSAQDSFWQKPLCTISDVKLALELLAKKLLCKVRSIEQSFGFRPIPTLSLSLRHVSQEPRAERRQIQLGSFKVGNPKCKVEAKGSDPSAKAGTSGDTLIDTFHAADSKGDLEVTLSESDQVLSQQLADRAFVIFQKIVPTEAAFSLHILNLQINFSESVRGQQSLNFCSKDLKETNKQTKSCNPSVTTVDLEIEEENNTEIPALANLLAMGFHVDRAKRALQESSSLDEAVELLIKKPRIESELVELD